MLDRKLLWIRLQVLALLAGMLLTDAGEAREGFFLGGEMAFADLSGMTTSGSVVSSGDGGGVTAGYGFNRYFAVEAAAWTTDHDSSGGGKVRLKAVQCGIKASLPVQDSHLEPYLLLGAGRYILGDERGQGWQYGAGLDISLSPSFMLVIGFAQHAFDLGQEPRRSVEATTMTIGLTLRLL